MDACMRVHFAFACVCACVLVHMCVMGGEGKKELVLGWVSSHLRESSL